VLGAELVLKLVHPMEPALVSKLAKTMGPEMARVWVAAWAE
jgi:hypothetical protein